MPKSKILFISANPETLPPIDSARELNTLREAVKKGQYREQCNLEDALEVKVAQLPEVLTKSRLRLLHVCCHGDENGALQLRDSSTGTPASVPPAELAILLRNAAPTAQCVVLSACYSEQTARQMLREGIPFVIGASQVINAEEANLFADVFYTALSNGLSLQAAFELGRGTLGLEMLRKDALALLVGEGMRADAWFLVEPPTGDKHAADVTGSALAPVSPMAATGPVGRDPPSTSGGVAAAASGATGVPQALRDQLLLARQLFEGRLTQMDLIRQHKQIHDDLQGLESALRLSLDKIDTARESGGDAALPPFALLRPHLRDASTKIESLLKTIKEGSIRDKYEDALATLEAAGQQIKEAQTQKSLAGLTSELNENLQSLLALELPKANDRLVAGVEQLQVDALLQALSSIRSAGAQLSPPSTAIAALLAVAASFAEQAEQLKRLNKEHSLWQGIDNKLRPLSSMHETLRKMLKSAWNTLPNRVNALLQLGTGEWVAQLKEQQEILGQEIGNQDDNSLRAEFDEYYRLVTQRFSEVDKLLLSLAGEIGKYGREIYGQLKAMV